MEKQFQKCFQAENVLYVSVFEFFMLYLNQIDLDLKLFGEMFYVFLCLKSLERRETRCVKAKGKWRDLLRYKDIWYVLPGK